MEVYEFTETKIAHEDEELIALTARILPLPQGILPSTRFMKQTRDLLMSLNDQRAFRAA